MSPTASERHAPPSAHFLAGQHAFLIGVRDNSNPYREETERDAWERGYANAKSHYKTRYNVEVKLAAFLGYPPPPRENKPVRRDTGIDYSFDRGRTWRPLQHSQPGRKPLKPSRNTAFSFSIARSKP